MYIDKFQKSLEAVLRIDPSLREIADRHVFPQYLVDHKRPGSFQYIVQSIISQQLSGLAARAIQNKFIGYYGQFPTPSRVIETSHEDLRSVGLSNQKCKYVLGVAEAYKDGTLSDEILETSTANEIVDRLVALKGIGAWSAQMFLLFYTRDMDVFSPGDLGVQRGFKHYMNRPGAESIKKTLSDDCEPETLVPQGTCKKALMKVPLPPECKHMCAVASKFRPHRSAFQLLMWKLGDTVVEIGKRPEPNGAESPKSAPKRVKKSAKVKQEIKQEITEVEIKQELDSQVQAPRRRGRPRKAATKIKVEAA